MVFLARRQAREAKLAVGIVFLFFMLLISLGLSSAVAGGDPSLRAPDHALPQSTRAKTLRVCASGCDTYDYTTIGQAIAAASSGDEIHVARGTYVELLSITNKSLTLLGGYSRNDWGVRNPDAFPTIIDGSDQGIVVNLDSTTGQHVCMIDGFTIKGGYSTGSGGGIKVTRCKTTISNNNIHHNNAAKGGGIYVQYSTTMDIFTNTLSYNTVTNGGGAILVWNAAASIRDNDIHDNTATRNGGGIFVDDATVRIADNEIKDNVSQDKGGGGIYFQNGAVGMVTGNRIASNDAYLGGGGIRVELNSDVTIEGNTILNNTTSRAGGGITVSQSNTTIEDNDFVGNVATRGGGGMQIILDSTGLIYNNRFRQNQVATVQDGGGAIHFWLSSPQFISNTVVSNTAGKAGGGVNIAEASPQILNNVITDNHTNQNGGGINIVVGSYPVVADNLIARNTAGSSGGIHVFDSGPRIERNEIVDNEATKGGGVGFVDGTGFKLINNIIARNRATDQGGGIHVGGSSTGNIINNTFASNNLGAGGEAINLRGDAVPRIANNILVWHTYGVQANATSPTVEYNNAWQNSVANYAGVGGGPGSISRDPQFVNAAAGDYHLTAGSGVIDAGTGTGAPNLDFDGNPRPLDGDVNGSALWDMGAYEYQNPVWITKEANPSAADPGDTINYTITYRNNSAGTATGVVISDILSTGLINPSFTFSGANITRRGGTTYVWDVENLSPGEGGTIIISAQTNPNIATPSYIPNTAQFYGVEIGLFSDHSPVIIGGLKTYVPATFKDY